MYFILKRNWFIVPRKFQGKKNHSSEAKRNDSRKVYIYKTNGTRNLVIVHLARALHLPAKCHNQLPEKHQPKPNISRDGERVGGFIAYDISVFSNCNTVHRIWIPHKPPLCENINGCVSQCCISAHKRPSSTPTYRSTSLVYQQTLPKVMTKFVLVAICLKTMPTSHMFERVICIVVCRMCRERGFPTRATAQ